MAANDSIGAGSRVTLNFTLTLEDGTEVDATADGEALVFTLGDGTLHPGLEALLSGLKAGDHERFSVAPEQAFGQPDPANIHSLPRSEFAADMPLAPGMVIGFTTPTGEELPGLIREVGAETVSVDFNHPLAGHTLTFELEVLAVDNS